MSYFSNAAIVDFHDYLLGDGVYYIQLISYNLEVSS